MWPTTRAGSGLTLELSYQPMQEVLHYLRDNGYRTYMGRVGSVGDQREPLSD